MPVAGRQVTVSDSSVPTNAPQSTPQSQSTEIPVGSIVGGLAGGIAIAMVIGIVWLWWERRQTQWPKLPPRTPSSGRPSAHYSKRVSFTVTRWEEDNATHKTDSGQDRAPGEVTVIEQPVTLPEPSWLGRPSTLQRMRSAHAPAKPSPLATHSPIIASPLPSTPSSDSPVSPNPMLTRTSNDPSQPSRLSQPPMYYQDDGWVPPDPTYGPYSSADPYVAYKVRGRDVASEPEQPDQQQVKLARRISRKPVPSIDGTHTILPPVPAPTHT